MDVGSRGTQAGWAVSAVRRRRWVWVLGGVLATGVTTVGWWMLSAPINPGDEATVAWYAWAPRKLKTLAVNAIGEQIRHYIREQVETDTFKTTLNARQMTERLRDESADPAERRKDAYRLARSGAPENIAAVQEFLKNAGAEDKAAIAHLLGLADTPQNRAMLWDLLNDPDERVVCAAIQGLSMLGGADVTERLTHFLNSEFVPLAYRKNAAAGLANVGTPAAFSILAQSYSAGGDAELTSAVLLSLSSFPFGSESERIFRAALTAPHLPLEARVSAIEALSDCPEGAAAFLVNVAASAKEWEVRSGAAWALSKIDAVPNGPGTLLQMAETENDEVVRRRLYEALQVHSDVPPERVFVLAMAETDISARVAGFNTAGLLARQHPEFAARFDAAAVGEMEQLALSEASENLRMRAVFALRRGGTPAAIEALRRIGNAATGNVGKAALNGI